MVAPLIALSLLAAPSFKPSVQAWTFNRFTATKAIELTAQAGGQYIELFPGQAIGFQADGKEVTVGPHLTADQNARLKEILQKNGVQVAAYGVTGISKDPAEARYLFKWAKSMGIEIINTESAEAMDTIEMMVKEFDMKVGFHNHPRQMNNPNYKMWDPNYVASILKGRDKRIGACADTGHWIRSGIKPMDAIRILKGRIVSSHLKDLNVFSANAHDVPYGTGVSDIPAILDELKKQGFTGTASVEYEHNWDTNVNEVAQCLGFVRGYTKK